MPIPGGQESAQNRQHSMPGMEITPGISQQQQQQQGKNESIDNHDRDTSAVEIDILRGMTKVPQNKHVFFNIF